jgi:hypothetical protein
VDIKETLEKFIRENFVIIKVVSVLLIVGIVCWIIDRDIKKGGEK